MKLIINKFKLCMLIFYELWATWTDRMMFNLNYLVLYINTKVIWKKDGNKSQSVCSCHTLTIMNMKHCLKVTMSHLHTSEKLNCRILWNCSVSKQGFILFYIIL